MSFLLGLYKATANSLPMNSLHSAKNYVNMFHSKITWPFPQKSHECALKLTDLWITSLLFDLNYKFINMSFVLYITYNICMYAVFDLLGKFHFVSSYLNTNPIPTPSYQHTD